MSTEPFSFTGAQHYGSNRTRHNTDMSTEEETHENDLVFIDALIRDTPTITKNVANRLADIARKNRSNAAATQAHADEVAELKREIVWLRGSIRSSDDVRSDNDQIFLNAVIRDAPTINKGSALRLYTILKERDSLRAEVERLKAHDLAKTIASKPLSPEEVRDGHVDSFPRFNVGVETAMMALHEDLGASAKTRYIDMLGREFRELREIAKEEHDSCAELRAKAAEDAKEIAGLKEQRNANVIQFAEAILHGDIEHREWLTSAAKAFTEAREIPTVNGLGRAESAEVRATQAEAACAAIREALLALLACANPIVKDMSDVALSTAAAHAPDEECRKQAAALYAVRAALATTPTEHLSKLQAAEADSKRLDHLAKFYATQIAFLMPREVLGHSNNLRDVIDADAAMKEAR